MLIVDVDGAIEWGGVIWTRNPIRTATAKTLTLGGCRSSRLLHLAGGRPPPTTPRRASTRAALTLLEPRWGSSGGRLLHRRAQIIYDAIRVSGSALSTMAHQHHRGNEQPEPDSSRATRSLSCRPLTPSSPASPRRLRHRLRLRLRRVLVERPGQPACRHAQHQLPPPWAHRRFDGPRDLRADHRYSCRKIATQQGNNLYGSASDASLVAQVGPDETVCLPVGPCSISPSPSRTSTPRVP